jgi:hypothetical protein
MSYLYNADSVHPKIILVSPPRCAATSRLWSLEMHDSLRSTCLVFLLLVAALPATAGPAAQLLPVAALRAARSAESPVANAAFAPGADAKAAPELVGTLSIAQTSMTTMPAIVQPVIGGRDARLFPGLDLQLFTAGDLLVPVARGTMLREAQPGAVTSYWRVIPQVGRVWHETADGDWHRAALPLMLVNDTENHAHQGLATFVYRRGEISGVRLQFVQQTGPYLVKPHLVAWGHARATWRTGGIDEIDARRREAARELANRIPARPWSELTDTLPAGTLDGFGEPLRPEWTVATALLRDGVLYYRAEPTAFGPYPYPLEMRFGVRSIMKSVAAPLSLLHLAEVYGPWVLALKVGDFVPGLDPKYGRVRFVDAASMASGFGGTGTLRTHPNDIYDGYLGGNYDAWYTAPSQAEKLAQIVANLRPYPWEPGTVVRYRDQDFYLLGIAVDNFLKSLRGPHADAWTMVQEEVFAPIGVAHAPAVRTREDGGVDGPAWFNAGYYPTLDDLAKIARLYQNAGAWNGKQLLHRELTQELLAARGALRKGDDGSMGVDSAPVDAKEPELYRMGFHYTPYRTSRDHRLLYIPTMSGSGENEVLLLPNGLVAIRTAKASGLPAGVDPFTGDPSATIRAIERLAPF